MSDVLTFLLMVTCHVHYNTAIALSASGTASQKVVLRSGVLLIDLL